MGKNNPLCRLKDFQFTLVDNAKIVMHGETNKDGTSFMLDITERITKIFAELLEARQVDVINGIVTPRGSGETSDINK